MLLLFVALLLHFSILVQFLAICCFGKGESEKSPAPSPPAPFVARSPDKVRSPSPPKENSIPLEKTQEDEKTPNVTKQIKIRELADESQMSKSLKKIESEYSNEVDDPFDPAQLPLPPPELRNSTKLAVVSS